MNNEVFDKHPYFVAHRGANTQPDDVRNAPLYHLGDGNARTSLSANAAYTLSKCFQNTTCIAVFKPEFFTEKFGFSIGTQYGVRATWTLWSLLNITIKLHTQHMTIANRTRFPCASKKYVGLWQEYMHKWSKSLQQSYVIMRQRKYWTQRRKMSREITEESGKQRVELRSSSEGSDDEADTGDLEAILPDIPELQLCIPAPAGLVAVGPWCGFNLQTLSSLHPTKMLHECVLNNYMFLLKDHFSQISFVPRMMSLHNSLRHCTADFDAQQSFCKKYLFKDKQPGNTNTFIFAMNPGLHWIAFKIDLDKQYIATICSMKDNLSMEASKLKTCISTVHPKARSFRHISVPVPHQHNHYDCGPLCCMFMLFLAQHDISAETRLEYDTLPTAAAMRLRIFADIAEKKLTILHVDS